jgi:hypothetical protein
MRDRLLADYFTAELGVPYPGDASDLEVRAIRFWGELVD